MNAPLKSNHRPKKASKKSIILKKLIKKLTQRYLKLFFHRWLSNSKSKLQHQINQYQNYEDDSINDSDENQRKNEIKNFQLKPRTISSAKINSLENDIFSPLKEINKSSQPKSKKYILEWGARSLKRTSYTDYKMAKTKIKNVEESNYTNDNELKTFSNENINKIKAKIKSVNDLNINNFYSVKILKKIADSTYNMSQQVSESNNLTDLNKISQNKEKCKIKKYKSKKSEKLYKNWSKIEEIKIILKSLINKQNKKYLQYYFYKWLYKIEKNILDKKKIIKYKEKDNENKKNPNANNNIKKNNNDFYDEKDLNDYENKSNDLTNLLKKFKKSRKIKDDNRNIFKSQDIIEKNMSKVNREISKDINKNPKNNIEIPKANDIKYKNHERKPKQKIKTKDECNTIGNPNKNDVAQQKIFDTEGNNSSKIRHKNNIRSTALNLGNSYLKQRSINYSKEGINPDADDIEIRQEDESESDKKRNIAKKFKFALHLLRKAIRSFQKKYNNFRNQVKIKYYLFKWKYIISFKNNKNKRKENYNFKYKDNGGNNYKDNIKMIYDNDEENKENYKKENENNFENDFSIYSGLNLYKRTYTYDTNKNGNFISSSYDAKNKLYKSQVNRDYFVNNFIKFDNNYNLHKSLNLKTNYPIKCLNSEQQDIYLNINEFNRSSNFPENKKKNNNGKDNYLRYSYNSHSNYKKRKRTMKNKLKIKNKLFLLIQKVINKQLKELKKKYFLKWYDLTFNYPFYIPDKIKKTSKKNKTILKYSKQNLYPNLNLNFNENNKYKKISNNTITEETKSQISVSPRMKNLKFPSKSENKEEDFKFHYENIEKNKKMKDNQVNGINYLNIEINEKNNYKNDKSCKNNKKSNIDNENKKKKNKITKNNSIKTNQNKLNGRDKIHEEYIDKISKKMKIPELFNEIKQSMIINSRIYKMIANTRENIKEKFNINSYLNFVKQNNKVLGAYQLYYLYLMLNEDNEYNIKKYFFLKWKKTVGIKIIGDKHRKNCICNMECMKYKECYCHELNIILKKILVRHIYMKKVNKRRYYLFLWYKKCFGKARDVYFIKEK